MKNIGVAFGRFQGFHLEHLEYLLESSKRCDFLIVGITNYEPCSNTNIKNPVNINRTKLDNNPFTYYERLQMVKGSLLEAGIQFDQFDIVPFPIEHPELIKHFVPSDAVFYLPDLDEWQREKIRCLKNHGLNVQVLYERAASMRGTEIRDLIRNGKDFSHLVPPFVAKYIKENKLNERLAKTEEVLK